MPQQINREETNSLAIQFIAFNSKAHTSYEYFNTTDFYLKTLGKTYAFAF